MRARQAGALVVLGSATPSLESYQNALNGRYTLVTLEKRVLDRPLADVRIVDMREEYAAAGPDVILSGALCDALAARLQRREQAIVLLNRRGFATLGLLPAVRGDARMPELQRVADRAPRRPARALPLLQLLDGAAQGLPAIAPARFWSSWASAPSASKRRSPRGFPTRASPASIATPSGSAAPSPVCWHASRQASSTSWSARR